MAILYINDEHCTSVEQLRSYFTRLGEGSVYEDILDYGRHGEISSWLREKGLSEYADGLDAIEKEFGDAEFVMSMSKVLSGEAELKLVKKPYGECFSVEGVEVEERGDNAEVKMSIKVQRGVNESYEIKVSSNWGTKAELFNPSEHDEGRVDTMRFQYHRRAGKGSFGEVRIEVEGEKIDVGGISKNSGGRYGNNNVIDEFVNGVNFKMIKVEGGTFRMGATSEQGSDAFSDESPVHSVTLPDYYIGETEVTQELWKAVMGKNPSSFKGDQKPVECVSWHDCQSFIKRLNELTGKSFRLPTEAEWEYAARGGNKSKGYKYSGGNDIKEVAWYDGNSNSQTHDVKTKSPNELGIYDMSGNVLEWCEDWFGYYSSSSQTNPKGPSSGSRRVLRGGGWFNGAIRCRVSNRCNGIPDNGFNDSGFRLAL